MRQAARNDSLEGIYKVETVPPPPGEDDAYNAETKVGALAKAAISKLLEEADEAERRDRSGAPPASQIRPSVTAKMKAEPKPPVVASAPAAMPVLWTDEDGDGSQMALEPTGLLEVGGPTSGPRERNTSPLPYPAVQQTSPPVFAMPPPPHAMQTFQAAPILTPVPAAPSRRRPSMDVTIAIATFAIVAGLAALVLSFLR